MLTTKRKRGTKRKRDGDSSKASSSKEKEVIRPPKKLDVTEDDYVKASKDFEELVGKHCRHEISLQEYMEGEKLFSEFERNYKSKLEPDKRCDEREASMGFVFRPSDGILLYFYLKRKCLRKKMKYCPIIEEANVYFSHPMKLMATYEHTGEEIWYFFSSSRFVEEDEPGDNGWRFFGKKHAVNHNGKNVGSRQTLVYFEAGKSTQYKLIEYKLNQKKHDTCICKLYLDARSLPSCVVSSLAAKDLGPTDSPMKIKEAPSQKAEVSVDLLTIAREDLREIEITRHLILKAQQQLQELDKSNDITRGQFSQAELKYLLLRRYAVSYGRLEHMQKREKRYLSRGFIFRPPEGLLVDYYLRIEAASEDEDGIDDFSPIYPLNIHEFVPERIIDIIPHTGDGVYYFLSTYHYPVDGCIGGKKDKAHWRIYGENNHIDVLHQGKKVGGKQLLEFYRGEKKTKYKLIEYNLEPIGNGVRISVLYDEEESCSCVKGPLLSFFKK